MNDYIALFQFFSFGHTAVKNVFQANTNSETIWECLGDTTESKEVMLGVQILTPVGLQSLCSLHPVTTSNFCLPRSDLL